MLVLSFMEVANWSSGCLLGVGEFFFPAETHSSCWTACHHALQCLSQLHNCDISPHSADINLRLSTVHGTSWNTRGALLNNSGFHLEFFRWGGGGGPVPLFSLAGWYASRGTFLRQKRGLGMRQFRSLVGFGVSPCTWSTSHLHSIKIISSIQSLGGGRLSCLGGS